ncbi:hypothetical protein GN278_11095 [Rhodobacteraceae bacterium Araon29]
MKSKIGISTAFVVAVATALSGCAKDPTDDPQHKYRQDPRQTWALDVERDECAVSEIVQEYYETGAWGNQRSYSWDILRQDQDSLTRAIHRAGQWNILDYIVSHERFEFHASCRSDFSRSEVHNGAESPNKIDLHFRSDQNKTLCTVTDKNAPGLVQSCINVETGSKTFDVIRNN